MMLELVILQDTRAILVDRVKSVVERRRAADDAELLQREPELVLVELTRMVLIKVAECVDNPVEVLGERHLELAKDARHACLLCGIRLGLHAVWAVRCLELLKLDDAGFLHVHRGKDGRELAQRHQIAQCRETVAKLG